MCFLDGSRDPGIRTKETNLGNLVADSLKFAAESYVALTNGGDLWRIKCIRTRKNNYIQ